MSAQLLIDEDREVQIKLFFYLSSLNTNKTKGAQAASAPGGFADTSNIILHVCVICAGLRSGNTAQTNYHHCALRRAALARFCAAAGAAQACCGCA